MNTRTVKTAFAVLGIVVMVLVGAVVVTLVSLHSANSSSAGLSAQLAALRADQARLAANQDALAQAQKAASSATLAHLGVCWNETTLSDSSTEWVTYVYVNSPQVVSGVYQCQSGETFTSVVPQKSSP